MAEQIIHLFSDYIIYPKAFNTVWKNDKRFWKLLKDE